MINTFYKKKKIYYDKIKTQIFERYTRNLS